MNIKLFFLTMMLAASIILNCGCGPCAKCGPNRSCFDGVCQCDDPLNQDQDRDCEYSREKFFGTYTCTSSCKPGMNWTSSVSASSVNDRAVLISNYLNSGNSVIATVFANTALIIESNQNVDGTGEFEDNKISIGYSNPQPPPSNCVMSMQKL